MGVGDLPLLIEVGRSGKNADLLESYPETCYRTVTGGSDNRYSYICRIAVQCWGHNITASS